MPDGSGNTSSSSQTQGPPAMLQPYLNYGLQQATKLYQSSSPSYYPGSQVAAPSTATQAGWQDAITRAQQGSPVTNAAGNYLQGIMGGNPSANIDPSAGTASDAYLKSVIGGKYLNAGNPYQSAVDQSIRANILPQINAQFSTGGRYGSGAMGGTETTALANAMAPMHYQQYQQERATQDAAAQNLQSQQQQQYQYNQGLRQNAAGMAPNIANQDWQDIQNLQQVGGQQDQLAQNQINANMAHWNYNQNLAGNKLQQYLQSMGSMPWGTTSTSTSTPAGGDAGSQIMKILGGLAGGLLSDRTMKKNIEPLEGALDKVKALQGVSFDWIDEDDERFREIGFVAQDVAPIVPEVVGIVETDQGDKLGVDYPKLTALLVEALKELSAKVAALEVK
jgi:Chaperone of endosialidase